MISSTTSFVYSKSLLTPLTSLYPLRSTAPSNVRSLSTSSTRRLPSFTNLIQDLTTKSDGKSSASTGESMRDMISSLSGKSGGQVDTERRTKFVANKVIRPKQFTREALYDKPKPLPRPPINGPKSRLARRIDPFHITQTDPRDHALNPNFVYAFLDPLGKIKRRAETGLTWKSQRRVGKMVRRARAMGVVGVWTSSPSKFGLGTGLGRY